MRNNNKSILMMCCLILLTQLSCTRKQDAATTSVQIVLPAKIARWSTQSITPTSPWGLVAPQSLDSIDCYAIFIEASDLGHSQCSVKNQTNPLQFSQLYGQFAAGSVIQIAAPNGQNRKFGVIGFHSTSGQCQPVTASTFNPQQASEPILVGISQPVNLTGQETTVTIDVSLQQAQVIESCSGSSAFAQLPNHYWPPAHCQPTISQITSHGGTLQLNGNCLNGIQSLSLKNQTTQTLTPLNLTAKSEQTLSATVSAHVQLRMGQIMQLLIQTAHGQTPVPFELTLGPQSVPLSAINTNGASDGFVLKYNQSAGSPEWVSPGSSGSSTGFGFKLIHNGQQIGEVQFPEIYSPANIVISPNSSVSYRATVTMPTFENQLYFFTNIYIVPNDRNQIPLRDLLFFEGGVRALHNIHFTGSNCSGNLVLQMSNISFTRIGDTFAYPSSCSNNADVNSISCSTLSYKKITGTPIFQSNISIQSTIEMQSALSPSVITNPSTNSNYFVCINHTSYNSNGWVYSSSNIEATVTPNQIPLILNRNQISFNR